MTLTPEVSARRVAIALDVLEQIRLRRLNVRVGRYFALNSARYQARDIFGQPLEYETADLQAVVDSVTANCRVCAKGAMLLSLARCFDSVPFRLVITRDGYSCLSESRIVEMLADTFDCRTLDAIENVFELTNDGSPDDPEYGTDDTEPGYGSSPYATAAYAFGKTAHPDYVEGAEARIIATMNNIVANAGVFDPTQTPDTKLPERPTS